eukprot:gene17672-biopygen2968
MRRGHTAAAPPPRHANGTRDRRGRVGRVGGAWNLPGVGLGICPGWGLELIAGGAFNRVRRDSSRDLPYGKDDECWDTTGPLQGCRKVMAFGNPPARPAVPGMRLAKAQLTSDRSAGRPGILEGSRSSLSSRREASYLKVRPGL